MRDRDIFTRPEWSRDRRGWYMETPLAGEWDSVLVSSLVGKTVNIGDKDGGVYEGVTVTAFDERTGHLTLEGGVMGSAYRPEEARPLERPERLWAYDVARGYVHSGCELQAFLIKSGRQQELPHRKGIR